MLRHAFRISASLTIALIQLPASMVWADPATTCGLPATVVPVGVADGLPVGVQIIGPEYEDRTPLAFARLVEREFGGFAAPPGYA